MTEDANTVQLLEVVPKYESRRRRLPDERKAVIHKFSIVGHDGYITVGLYEDGTPGEIFIKIAKEGSTISGLLASVTRSVSVGLQFNVPLIVYVKQFINHRYEPWGYTTNPHIPEVSSITDYIARWLAYKFLSKEELKSIHLAINDQGILIPTP